VESLREGMQVTEEVKNMDNMLLIPAGCIVTERHINLLNAWGIAEIRVESLGETDEASDVLQRLPANVLAKLTDELKLIFLEPVDKHPIQAEVFNLVLRRKARGMGERRT
jgi:hypothetical protein